MKDQPIINEDIKFCPICGHEGTDVMCPVCNEKMESLNAEVERVADLEKKKDITESAGLEEVSLEEVAKEEEKESSE